MGAWSEGLQTPKDEFYIVKIHIQEAMTDQIAAEGRTNVPPSMVNTSNFERGYGVVTGVATLVGRRRALEGPPEPLQCKLCLGSTVRW